MDAKSIKIPMLKLLRIKNQTPLLEIWDWEGNLINIYALDEEIIGFCVSEENRKIYATTLNYTNQILIYDLPKY